MARASGPISSSAWALSKTATRPSGSCLGAITPPHMLGGQNDLHKAQPARRRLSMPDV
ncbi:Uncharacterised protein [Mycobacterium tuberculosis]|nr:Uncharacterised protein [Mycobacterium tuberculosis]